MYYLLSFLFTHSMEQRPSWEANRFSDSQGISRVLWNLKLHYRIYNSQAPDPILSQINPVQVPTSHFLKTYLEYYHPICAWVFQVVSFPQVSPPKPCLYLYSPTYVLHALPTSFVSMITWPVLGDECRSLSSSFCSFLHSPVTSSLLGPNILGTLFSNTFSLRSSLNVIDQVSHPYKTTDKIYLNL